MFSNPAHAGLDVRKVELLQKQLDDMREYMKDLAGKVRKYQPIMRD